MPGVNSPGLSTFLSLLSQAADPCLQQFGVHVFK
jgi:hypothetical protein